MGENMICRMSPHGTAEVEIPSDGCIWETSNKWRQNLVQRGVDTNSHGIPHGIRLPVENDEEREGYDGDQGKNVVKISRECLCI